MTNIKSIIAQGEGKEVEFKERMKDGAYKTISAFANTHGGILLCGVKDNKELIGIDASSKNIDKITNIITNNLKIYPLIDVVEIDSVKILCIKVRKSTIPVSFKDSYYIRVGTTTRKLEGESLVDFISRSQNTKSWETIEGNFSYDEIDEETLNRFIEMGTLNKRLKNINVEMDLKAKLNHLGMIKSNKLINAAILLFGKDPQKYFPNAVVRIAKIREKVNIINCREIKGNLFQQIDKFQEEIKNNTNVEFIIPHDDFQRIDVWEYPLLAIREGILNAVIHRDYSRTNVPTQVKIYENCIYIYNIGGLKEGISLKRLKEPHPSLSRNSIITNMVYRAGYIEELGTGIERMREDLEKAGHPDLDFIEDSYSFTLCIWGKFSNKNLKGKHLKERQIKAIEYAYNNREISFKKYKELNPKIPERTMRRDLAELVDKNLLVPSGETKGRSYKFNYSNGN